MVKKYFVFGTAREKSIGISVIMSKKVTEDQKFRWKKMMGKVPLGSELLEFSRIFYKIIVGEGTISW